MPLRRPPRRNAFTTIELLVVIGIILLLMAISVLGFRHLDKVASGKQTRAQLNLCKNLLIEYERVSGFKYIEESGLRTPNPTPPPQFYPIYLDPLPAPPANPTPRINLQLADLMAGNSSDVSLRSSSASARYAAQAVQNTRYVMSILAKIPANRTTLTNMPSNRILEASGGQPMTIDQAVVLDGWGNPIIFVPAGGIIVNVKDPTSSQLVPFVVRSSGTFPASQIMQRPTSALDRPFFASAGPDGKFTNDPNTTDDNAGDNVYSFQQD